jgi:predicted nucleotidyltransferase
MGSAEEAPAMRSGRGQKLRPSDLALLKEVKRRILEHVPGAKVFLYGSAARGEATPDSDYDVLVITPQKLTTEERRQVYHATYPVESEADAIVSLSFFSQEQWDAPMNRASPFYKNVIAESVGL